MEEMEGGLRDDDDTSRACNSRIIEMVQVKHSPDDEKSLTFPSITISVSSYRWRCLTSREMILSTFGRSSIEAAAEDEDGEEEREDRVNKVDLTHVHLKGRDGMRQGQGQDDDEREGGL